MRLFTLLQTAFTKIGTLMKRYNETADYVVENIADDNGWQLTKWNSGKLEGVRRWYGQLASTGAVGGFYYYIDSYTPPTTAKSIIIASADVKWGSGISWGSAREVNESSISVACVSNQAGTNYAYVYLYFIGTWK